MRGKDIEETAARKELTHKMPGSCIWNPRLKGGPGLLVPDTEENKEVLEVYCNYVEKTSSKESKLKRKEGEEKETKSSSKLSPKKRPSGEKAPSRQKKHSEEESTKTTDSDDELIQSSIRKTGAVKSEKKEESGEIDSDVEITVTLSRRSRYQQRQIEELKEQLAKLRME